jgi:serine O-acetyltransferase
MPSPCGCEGPGLRATVREDVDRYVYYAEVGGSTGGASGVRALMQVVLLSSGLWAVLGYRLAHHARQLRPRPLGLVVRGLAAVIQQILVSTTGITIDSRAHIGSGLMIPHGGYIVIGPSRIGRCCDILQGVTVGLGRIGEEHSPTDAPVLGDRVWVGPGAVIAEGVQVGSDASIGARSLVLRDVPPCGVVLGLPGRLISRGGSFAQVRYRGMGEDLDRAAALAGAGVTPSC